MIWQERLEKRIEKIKRSSPYLSGFSTKILIQSLYIIIFTLLLTLGFFANYQMGNQKSLKTLKRREYGQGTYEQEVYAVVGENGQRQRVKLEIEERQYSKTELENYQREVLEKLPKLILGENKDFMHITKPLNLVTNLKGNPIEIQWISSNPDLVSWEGKLAKDIPKEGEYLEIIGRLFFKETLYDYRQAIKVYPLSRESQSLDMRLKDVSQKENQDSKEEKEYVLPKSLEGKQVSWYEEKSKDFVGVLLLLLLFSGILPFVEREKRREKEKIKRRQMLLDYPEIVSKLTLLLGAGMSLRNAMGKIGLDYQKKRKIEEKKRWAYEEILYTLKEMERGVGEMDAYVHLGERSSLLKYKTLSSLLSQNVKKGSGSILRLLESEARDAFEDRKRAARVSAEEAGTKLLLPMILMLILIFMILLVPAMMNF